MAASAIRSGEVVAYPTETVYGLGANPFSEEALYSLFAAKERDPRHAVLLIVDSEAQLQEVVGAIPPRAAACMNAFWPGPLSLLFPIANGMPAFLAGPDGRICVRQTSSLVARALCRAVGHAITSTSANRSGESPVARLNQLTVDGIALGIDVGPLPVSAPSTIFDPETGKIVRPGAISEAALLSVC